MLTYWPHFLHYKIKQLFIAVADPGFLKGVPTTDAVRFRKICMSNERIGTVRVIE